MARTTSPASDLETAEPFFPAEAFADLDALSLFKSEPSGEVIAPSASATRYLDIQPQVRETGGWQRDSAWSDPAAPSPQVKSGRRWFGRWFSIRRR